MPEPGSASFRDLTIASFVDQLSSPAPVPGGGAASAIAASLGASLVAMVAGLSEGRPKYEPHAAMIADARATGERLAARFLDLADEDAAAYAILASAFKMPRETDEERAARAAAIRSAARAAAEAPFACVEACLDLVAAAEALAGRSNVNASSDVVVAALLGQAAARGAAENVLINLPSVGDESYAGLMGSRVLGLLDDIERLAAEAREVVRRGQARDPLPG
jgi:formiminotetrahydrofolate cyclodeaminase